MLRTRRASNNSRRRTGVQPADDNNDMNSDIDRSIAEVNAHAWSQEADTASVSARTAASAVSEDHASDALKVWTPCTTHNVEQQLKPQLSGTCSKYCVWITDCGINSAREISTTKVRARLRVARPRCSGCVSESRTIRHNPHGVIVCFIYSYFLCVDVDCSASKKRKRDRRAEIPRAEQRKSKVDESAEELLPGVKLVWDLSNDLAYEYSLSRVADSGPWSEQVRCVRTGPNATPVATAATVAG